MVRLKVITLCLALLCQAAGAVAGEEQPAREPLQAIDILKSSATHAPQILERLAKARAARGEALSAEGAFDTVVKTEGYGRVSGFWDGKVAGTTVSQNLRSIGGEVFGGYRLSDGRFPIYEDINFTNTGGELKAGFILSLLRDRAFDKQRKDVADAQISLSAADIEVLATSIGVQHKALRAYYQWVAAGAQLVVYRDLLTISEDRDRGLRRRVQEGDVAEILVVENRQTVLKRQMLVVEAERRLAAASIALSMFYRDTSGTPTIPDVDQLPDSFDRVETYRTHIDEHMVETAISDRPELTLVDRNLAKAKNALRLARNDLQPRLDFRYEVSRDFGAIAEGGSSRDSTDNVVGIEFKIPLQQRFAKGRIAAARADMQALELRRQRLEEQIAVDIRVLKNDLEAARRMVALAQEEQAQAETMQRVERQRFENGASDFFLLNIREETVADARVRRIGAQARYFMAQADFFAAIVDLEALGLEA